MNFDDRFSRFDVAADNRMELMHKTAECYTLSDVDSH